MGYRLWQHSLRGILASCTVTLDRKKREANGEKYDDFILRNKKLGISYHSGYSSDFWNYKPEKLNMTEFYLR